MMAPFPVSSRPERQPENEVVTNRTISDTNPFKNGSSFDVGLLLLWQLLKMKFRTITEIPSKTHHFTRKKGRLPFYGYVYIDFGWNSSFYIYAAIELEHTPLTSSMYSKQVVRNRHSVRV